MNRQKTGRNSEAEVRRLRNTLDGTAKGWRCTFDQSSPKPPVLVRGLTCTARAGRNRTCRTHRNTRCHSRFTMPCLHAIWWGLRGLIKLIIIFYLVFETHRFSPYITNGWPAAPPSAFVNFSFFFQLVDMIFDLDQGVLHIRPRLGVLVFKLLD